MGHPPVRDPKKRVEVRGSHPFHDKTVERMGHPSMWDGQDFKNLGWATRLSETPYCSRVSGLKQLLRLYQLSLPLAWEENIPV